MKNKVKNKQATCLCGSGIDAVECCISIIKGERQAKTAEQLMRSRYTAYVLQDADYILASWHLGSRPTELCLEDSVHWRGLNILEASRTKAAIAYVEFVAGFNNEGAVEYLRERSRFLLESARWYYLDGEQLPVEGYAIEPPGRNEPCYCGSGRKYKKCCSS